MKKTDANNDNIDKTEFDSEVISKDKFSTILQHADKVYNDEALKRLLLDGIQIRGE